MNLKITILLISSLFLSACSTLFNLNSNKLFQPEKSSFQFGFIIADSTGKILRSDNENKLFTPASILKLYHLPLFMTLKNDPDFLKTGISVQRKNDSLQVSIFSHGDPLLKSHELDSVANLIKKDSIPIASVVIYTANYDSSEFWGSGWMWDDEPDDYQAYLNSFPLDENTVSVHYFRENSTDYHFFEGIELPIDFTNSKIQINRLRTQNQIHISRPDSSLQVKSIKKIFSFRNPDSVIASFIGKKFNSRSVLFSKSISTMPTDVQFVIQHPFDSLMTRILTHSSNFCSEQSIRYIAIKNGLYGNIRNGLKVEKQLNLVSSNRVVDGSGLSRYNLITPESVFEIMKGNSFPRTTWFSQYSKIGTLDDRYFLNDKTIHIYAKSGTMTGVQNLAGFVFQNGKFIGYALLFTNNTVENKEFRYRFEKDFLDFAGEILKEN